MTAVRYVVFIMINMALAFSLKGQECASKCYTAYQEADDGCSSCKRGYYGRQCQYPLQCFSGKGGDYHGTKNITENNLKCQMWNSQKPNIQPWTRTHLPENYCRNPNTNVEVRPWCYNGESIQPRFQFCNIALCEDQCPAPVLKPFGDIINPPDEGFYVGVVVTLLTGCGPGTIGEQECLPNKKWSSGKNCKEIHWCSKPIIKANSYITPSQEEYYHNASITIECDTGYEADGVTIIYCQDDQTWGSVPNCNPLPCDIPLLPIGMSFASTVKNTFRYVYRDTLAILCNYTGLTTLLFCMADQTWGTIPNCTKNEEGGLISSYSSSIALTVDFASIAFVSLLIIGTIAFVVMKRRKRTLKRRKGPPTILEDDIYTELIMTDENGKTEPQISVDDKIGPVYSNIGMAGLSILEKV